MQVPLRCSYIRVAHRVLNRSQVGSGFEQMGAERVPEHVGSHALWNFRALRGLRNFALIVPGNDMVPPSNLRPGIDAEIPDTNFESTILIFSIRIAVSADEQVAT